MNIMASIKNFTFYFLDIVALTVVTSLLAGLVLLILRLAGAVSWTWVWVLSPLWIEACLILILLLLFFILSMWAKRIVRKGGIR